MGAGKKNPAGFSLVAHDEVEGKSEEGRALFRELCDEARQKGKTKELNEIHVGRVLDGQRRVTRDLLLKVMDISEVPNEQRAALWERYFGGAPTSIAEGVRRAMILSGSIRDYGTIVDLSHPSLCWIMNNRATTADSFRQILVRDPTLSLPWKGPELMTQWRHEYEQYHMKKFDSNLLAARVETLFEMRPTASRSEWVERGNMPESLKGMSKNKIRILLSALRHGEPISWESVDRVLFGMKCTLTERAEVAHAWLQAMITPPPPHKKRETAAPKDDDDGEKKRSGVKLSDIPIPQSDIPYPAELVNQPSLAIIRKLVDELQSSGTAEGTFVSEINAAIGAVESIPTAAVPEPEVSEAPRAEKNKPERKSRAKHTESKAVASDTSQVDAEKAVHDDGESPAAPGIEEVLEEAIIEDPETLLFGPPKEIETHEDEVLPDFAQVRTVWLLAEYLENFGGREYAGFSVTGKAFRMIATEVLSRAPFGINDTASAMKMLAYSYGRFPDGEAVEHIVRAIEQSIGTEGNVPGRRLMELLAKESRFRMFLLYYRDAHPESKVTKLFASLTDLTVLEKPETYDTHAATDRDKDYHERLRPTPKPRKTEKKKEYRSKFHLPEQDAIETEDDPWGDD